MATLWTAKAGDVSGPQNIEPDPNGNVTLDTGGALYFELTFSATATSVDLKKLNLDGTGTLPFYSDQSLLTDRDADGALKPLKVFPEAIYLIPNGFTVEAASTVFTSVDSTAASISAHASALAAHSAFITSSTSATSTSTFPAPASDWTSSVVSPTNATQTSTFVDSPSSTSSADAALSSAVNDGSSTDTNTDTTTQSSDTSPAGEGSSDDNITLRAAIGGSLGGLIVGIALALLAFWCSRRRRPRASKKNAHWSRSSDANLIPRASPMAKEMQIFEAPTAVTGWQKHLPQEKDDRTIANAVKTIFDQVQMHVEGFYITKTVALTASASAALERVSPDGLSKRLPKAPNSIPILEGILIRWIVHRISLRSDAGASFLPFEYTKIPEQNGWHMESDEGANGQVAESSKG